MLKDRDFVVIVVIVVCSLENTCNSFYIEGRVLLLTILAVIVRLA